jgi:hypothetical protein
MSAKASKEDDPVALALAKAPVDTVAVSEEEARKVAEARASLARGERTYSQEEIEAMIAERRRKAGG